MTADIDQHIQLNCAWSKLPTNLRQSLSQKDYDKKTLSYSIQHQLRYKGNLVRTVKKDERRYYEELLDYSRKKLMLYPYHLADVIVKGLRITPFAYYTNMMCDIMGQERSYDSLPNFTAADCVRLLGIGRNEYIDLMNQCRSGKLTDRSMSKATSFGQRLFRRTPIRDLLPSTPLAAVGLESWWRVEHGYITEDDMRLCSAAEKEVIDDIIDRGDRTAGDLDHSVVMSLYRRGLVYFDIPVAEEDCVLVPTLEGFVMNRTQGDSIENRLYDVFFSVDQNSNISELATVLNVDISIVKNSVSVLCRLRFAIKKQREIDIDLLHPSWKNVEKQAKKPAPDQLIIDWTESFAELEQEPDVEMSRDSAGSDTASQDLLTESAYSPSVERGKRLGLIFDSTLTAFLMMGNLSPGLKSHAVTMFEVGKLTDESMDNFLSELEKVNSIAEGEAQRYFDHAGTLRDCLRFLRHNPALSADSVNRDGLPVDLLRCESLSARDSSTRARILAKNYSLLLSLAPITQEVQPVSSVQPPHLGPAVPEVCSVWFKLYLYSVTGSGPPSLLLRRGTRLVRLPDVFQRYEKLLVTTWGHDPGVISASNALLTLNDALTHSAAFIQGHGFERDGDVINVAFPISDSDKGDFHPRCKAHMHTAIQKLQDCVDLRYSCGFVSLLCPGSTESPAKDEPKNGLKDEESLKDIINELNELDTDSTTEQESEVPLSQNPDEWYLLDCQYGLPLFDDSISKQVCRAIESHQLFSEQSLSESLKGNRSLTLRLLDFIHKWQGRSVLGRENSEHTLPLPASNILFSNGQLQHWNCYHS